MDLATTIVSTATLLVAVLAAAAAVRAYRVIGGLREIPCSEAMDAALVKIRVAHAIASVSGGNDMRLKSCSLWPGRMGCD